MQNAVDDVRGVAVVPLLWMCVTSYTATTRITLSYIVSNT
jgi:hypothetical protein